MGQVRRTEGAGNNHNKPQQQNVDLLKEKAKQVKAVQQQTFKEATKPYKPNRINASIEPKGTVVDKSVLNLNQTSDFFERVKNQ